MSLSTPPLLRNSFAPLAILHSFASLTLDQLEQLAPGIAVPLESLPPFSTESALPVTAFPLVSQDLSFREIFCAYRLWFGLSGFASRQEPFPPLDKYTGQWHFLEGFLHFFNLLRYVVLTPSWKETIGTRSRPIDLETTSSSSEMEDQEVGGQQVVDVDEAMRQQPFKAEGIVGLIYEADLPLLRAAYQIPDSVVLRAPSAQDRACTFSENEVCLYEEAFRAGLRLPFPRIVRDLLSILHLAPGQLMPNAWKIFYGALLAFEEIGELSRPMTVNDFLCCYSVKMSEPGFWFFQARDDRQIVFKLPTSVKRLERKVFLCFR